MAQRSVIWPTVRETLKEIYDPSCYYLELVLTGAIGAAKTYIAGLVQAYQLYVLSCYYSPQLEFDMPPGMAIVFVFQNRSAFLAKKVTFGKFHGLIKNSKYFREVFPYDTGKVSELDFPNDILCVPLAGNDTAALGMDVYGGVIDEVNFMARIKKSVASRFTGEEEYDQAERVYSSIIERMKSRFARKGKVPGKLCIVSSSNYPDDFTDRKVKEAEKDPTIFVYRKAQWEALPADRFSDKTFLVELGDDTRRSRVIASRIDAIKPDNVIEVPEDYRKQFERDIESAVRNLAGMPTGVKNPFITRREKIKDAIDRHIAVYKGHQLFVNDVLDADYVARVIGTLEDGKYEQLVPKHILDKSFLKILTEQNRISLCAVHIDLGLTNDYCGIGVSRIAGVKSIVNRIEEEVDGKAEIKKLIEAPIYHILGALGLRPPGGVEEIDIDMVMALVLGISTILPVRYVSMDSYQSAWELQVFRRKRFITGQISVDKSIRPYNEYKYALYEDRIMQPVAPLLRDEVTYLQRDRKTGKIDHIERKSKDISDGVAGSLWVLLNNMSTTINQIKYNKGASDALDRVVTERTNPIR
jgi:hypothetical protein